MLYLVNVSKSYPAMDGRRAVLDGVNMTILEGQKWGVLGRNGSGKSTLVRLLAGAEDPTFGHVRRLMSVSWPLAFGGGFQGGLTGFDNAKFVARIYQAPIKDVVLCAGICSDWTGLLRAGHDVFLGHACPTGLWFIPSNRL